MSGEDQHMMSDLNGDYAENSKKSLRDKALERALGGSVPKTLTPWEWEQWYAEHGQPEEHKRPS